MSRYSVWDTTDWRPCGTPFWELVDLEDDGKTLKMYRQDEYELEYVEKVAARLNKMCEREYEPAPRMIHYTPEELTSRASGHNFEEFSSEFPDYHFCIRCGVEATYHKEA